MPAGGGPILGSVERQVPRETRQVDFDDFERLNFRLPGPTPLPPAVREAMRRPMIHHRGPLLKRFYVDLLAKLRQIHRTEHDVLVWPGSGSAGWEAAIVNLLSPGDAVLATVIGDFGDRWAKAAARLGLDVRRLDCPWGQALTVEELSEALERNPDVKAVFLTHNETSTAVTNPLPELAAAVRDHGALVLVDAVSSAAALPLETDAWGLDVVLSGSQKAWMCPPGLVIAAFGLRCWDAYEASRYPRFFWDIRSARDMASQGMTPTTPPLTLLYALDAATDLIQAEGLEKVWERHARLGRKTRDGVTDLGLELLADPNHSSDSVTAVNVPEGLTSRRIIDHMVERHRVLLQGGQGPMVETVVRIGHMGWCDEVAIDDVLASLAATRNELGLPVAGRAAIGAA